MSSNIKPLLLRFPNGSTVPYCEDCFTSNVEICKEENLPDFDSVEATELNPEPGGICDCCNEPLTSEEAYVEYWNELCDDVKAGHLKLK